MSKNADLKDYEALFDLFIQHKNDDSLRPLIELCRHFFRQRKACLDLLVFSAPINHVEIAKQRPDGWLRTVFGRESLPSYAKLEEEIRGHWGQVKFPDNQVVELSGQSFQFLRLGKFDDQFLFALIRSDHYLNTQLLSLFSRLTQKSLEEISRWREVSRYESLIYIDDVTLLFNQRKLVIDIDQAVLNYKKTNENFAVLFIDIDHFKQVNDQHGHLVGTQILADVASHLRGLLRDTDMCYRYGGDEFVLLIPDTSPDNARLIGQRILETITARSFVIDEKELLGQSDDSKSHAKRLEFKLSVSVGVAAFPQDAKSSKEILSIADKMMYEAKKSGRGQVCFAGEMFGKGA